MKPLAVDRIPVPNQISPRLFKSTGLQELPPRPGSRRIRGDVEVQDPATIVTRDDEHEQHLERRRRHGKEVERDKLFRMIVEERTPALRRWPTTLDHVLRDRGLRNLDAKLQ